MATDELVQWVAPDGTVTQLSGTAEIDWVFGVQGRFMPPVDFTEEDVPFQDGTMLREVRARPREVVMPVDFMADDIADLRLQLREIVRLFSPMAGDGRLRITSYDDGQRELVCRYRSGLEIVEEFTQVAGWQRAVIVLRAFDPYWADVSDTSQLWTTTEQATFFPFFPLRLSSSEVFVAASVDNAGDVDAWPVWQVIGPGSALVLRNLTTGKSLELATTIAAGSTVTIDTRPGAKTVVDESGANLFGDLSATSDLWSLIAGSNSVQVELGGSTGATQVSLLYKRRYLSA